MGKTERVRENNHDVRLRREMKGNIVLSLKVRGSDEKVKRSLMPIRKKEEREKDGWAKGQELGKSQKYYYIHVCKIVLGLFYSSLRNFNNMNIMYRCLFSLFMHSFVWQLLSLLMHFVLVDTGDREIRDNVRERALPAV